MPTRFIRVGTCYINPWSTAGVIPGSYVRGYDAYSQVVLHSGEKVNIDASADVVAAAIEEACKDDGVEDVPLATAVGHGRE